MSAARLLEMVRSWNVVDLPAHAAQVVDAMTEEQGAELVAMLVPAADGCAREGKLSTMPNFMPRGNIYNRTDCEAFQEPGWLISRRRAPAALPVFRELFGGHASREVRLASGHFLLAYDGTAEEVAERSVEPAKELVGWFRLWIGAQVALSPREAYVAIADRIATSPQPAPLLHAAMDVGWHAKIADPRWGDLAMMALEHSPRHHAALSILASTKDRRGVPLLLDEVRHPDYGTSSIGLAKLAQLLDDDELLDALAPIIESSSDKSRFESFFASRDHAAGMAMIEKARQARIAEIAARDLPFLFFGARPGDWYEGANDGHLYIICFDGILDATAKLRLAHQVRSNRQCSFARAPWLWGELDGNTWAQLYCGDDPFEEMRDALPEIHMDVPIREVIFGGLREESERDEWTIWSTAHGTAASRVPALSERTDYGMLWYYGGREVVPVAGSVDDTFERARR